MDFVHRYQYPVRTLSEKLADGAMHAVGLCGALAVVTWVTLARPDLHSLPMGLYLAIVILALAVSAAYHLTPDEDWREPLRRLDHAAIFLQIAATYTPLVFAVGSGFVALGVIWAFALTCAVCKVHFGPWPEWLSQGAYLTLGWLSGVVLWPLIQIVDVSVSMMIVAGGLTLSMGMVFLNWTKLLYSMAIWHGFVLVAISLFFASVIQVVAYI